MFIVTTLICQDKLRKKKAFQHCWKFYFIPRGNKNSWQHLKLTVKYDMMIICFDICTSPTSILID